jgi:hypothetical protein
MNCDGYIDACKCISCSLTVNDLVFRGDTDMATSGLVAAALPGKDEVVIVATTADEWNHYDKIAIAKRVNKTFNREGFVVLEKKMFKDDAGKEHYDPICTNCGNWQKEFARLSLDEFVAKGGIIHELSAD